MRTFIDHKIETNPVLEDVGVIRIEASIFGENHHSTFSTESYVKEFIDNDECRSKQDLDYFLSEAGIISGEDVFNALINLVNYVDEVTCPASIEYSPGCSLDVWLDIYPEDNLDDEAEVEYDDAEMEEAVQASFDETRSARPRPASKHVVKSLTRKIYDKKIQKENKMVQISSEECTICLKEFSHGKTLVTLPCGHDFDDECIVKWLETNHVCPLCRFVLPCEEED